MKRRSPILSALAVLVPFCLCISALLVVNLTLFIPRRVAQTFGTPSSKLEYTQQIYYAVLLLLEEDTLTRPLDPNGSVRPFQIALGEPASSVIFRMHDEGLIASVEAFRNYLLYSGLDTTLQAGEYQLSPAMSAVQIAHELQDATPDQISFNILAGWRLEEIAAALPTSGLDISPDDFLESVRIARSGFVFSSSMPEQASLEGFFFPDTYEAARTLTLEGFIRLALERFQSNLTPEMITALTNQGLDIYDGVILASMVEREAVLDEEMPMIASVFLNRLAVGMKLDSDPTVQYALGYNGAQKTWWTNPLTLEHLKVESPYNTYTITGLPRGPIANPGIQALKAVAFPTSSPYFYFRAACDGSGKHVFAQTFEEHVANGCP